MGAGLCAHGGTVLRQSRGRLLREGAPRGLWGKTSRALTYCTRNCRTSRGPVAWAAQQRSSERRWQFAAANEHRVPADGLERSAADDFRGAQIDRPLVLKCAARRLEHQAQRGSLQLLRAKLSEHEKCAACDWADAARMLIPDCAHRSDDPARGRPGKPRARKPAIALRLGPHGPLHPRWSAQILLP